MCVCFFCCCVNRKSTLCRRRRCLPPGFARVSLRASGARRAKLRYAHRAQVVTFLIPPSARHVSSWVHIYRKKSRRQTGPPTVCDIHDCAPFWCIYVCCVFYKKEYIYTHMRAELVYRSTDDAARPNRPGRLLNSFPLCARCIAAAAF